MPKLNRKPALSLAASNGAPEDALTQLVDNQVGPLAEAEAIADALACLTHADVTARPDTLATLSLILCVRLDQVRGILEDHLAVAGGAQ